MKVTKFHQLFLSAKVFSLNLTFIPLQVSFKEEIMIRTHIIQSIPRMISIICINKKKNWTTV